MIHAITVPKWGLSMDHAIVRDWCVAEDQKIVAGQAIVELETEKIANALECEVSGVLRRIVAPVGTTVLVGNLLGVVADAETSGESIEAFIRQFNATHATPSADSASPVKERAEKLRVASLELAFQILESPNPDRVPVLMLHGFGGDKSNWQFVMPGAGIERTAYALDLPGHGGSTKLISSGTVAFLAQSVLDFANALDLKRTHLVGHSLGAAVALSVADSKPGLAASLTLIAPAGLGADINQEFIDRFVGAETRREMQQALAMLVADPNLVTKDFVESMQRAKRIDGAQSALDQIARANFEDGRQRYDGRTSCRNLATRTLVITGSVDQIIPNADIRTVCDNIDLHKLVNVGHMPHIEAPARVSALLDAHLKKHDA